MTHRLISGSVYAPEFLCSSFLKTWRVNFLLLVREMKNSHATTKQFSRRFLRKHAPQSAHFWFVFP
ncbi:hypothetical protein CLI75_07975 [Porphyromonas gingivalis]|nr:hypothetical protein CLI75_07975 [Porphyromonas gingivalis]